MRRNGRPDSKLALQRYRRLAAGYDATAQREMPRRLRCIDKLALRPGDVVEMTVEGIGTIRNRVVDNRGPAFVILSWSFHRDFR